MNKLTKHLKVVHNHRKYVFQACNKMGIVWQGLIHDLSKYSIKELSICKYYVGTRSPHAEARDQIGYSPSWLNHYHKNKHHYQFWLDIEDWPDKIIPIKMPYKYVIEMFCDFVGAGKAYNPNNWTKEMPWDYWEQSCEGKRLMHKESEYLIKKLLWIMHEADSESSFYEWYKKNKGAIEDYYNNGEINY